MYVFWEDREAHVGHVLQLCKDADADLNGTLDSDSVIGNAGSKLRQLSQFSSISYDFVKKRKDRMCVCEFVFIIHAR